MTLAQMLDLFTVLSAIIAATGTILIKVAGLRSKMQEDLKQCNEERETLKVRVSAFETELVVLRKLLPGGEWFIQLGLDKHPYPPEKLH